MQEKKVIKRITFSADEVLIDKARKKPKKKGYTLSELFREWLASYVAQESREEKYLELMKQKHISILEGNLREVK